MGIINGGRLTDRQIRRTPHTFDSGSEYTVHFDLGLEEYTAYQRQTLPDIDQFSIASRLF